VVRASVLLCSFFVRFTPVSWQACIFVLSFRIISSRGVRAFATLELLFFFFAVMPTCVLLWLSMLSCFMLLAFLVERSCVFSFF